MKCHAPLNIVNPRTPDDRTNRIEVPCNKCAACLETRRGEWTNRIIHEQENSTGAQFITLTYEDDKLTWGESHPTLVKSDLQKFFKILRKNIHPDKIRYYAVGEYGTNTLRPHYHVILFNLNINKIDEIHKAWKHGHTHIGEVNRASIHYVCKYHLNKNYSPPGCQESFATMSRKPGIGHSYIEKSRSYHEGKIDRNYLLQRGGIKSRLPRYYKERLYTDRERRAIAERAQQERSRWMDAEQIEEHDRMNPDVNFFDYKVQQIQDFERNHKIKINKTNKL